MYFMSRDIMAVFDWLATISSSVVTEKNQMFAEM